MNNVECILDFTVSPGARMLYVGANLERVDDTMTRICQSYDLKQISIYSLLAAMFAALYAEIMAMYRKVPLTVFLYPAIIPLIPGDLLYNTAVNFILQDVSAMLSNAANCVLALAGMSIGFVIINCRWNIHMRACIDIKRAAHFERLNIIVCYRMLIAFR